MRKIIFYVLIFSMFCAGMSFPFKFVSSSYAEPFENLNVRAKAYVLFDYESKNALLGENSDKKLPIASLTKIMTLSLVFDAIDSGELKLHDKIFVSETAADISGSQAFLDAGSSYEVDQLIKSVIMASANDSCIALAEKIAGTENAFVSIMNEKSKNAGLLNTHFANSTGLPSPDHYSSANDVAVMLSWIVNNPVFVSYSKIWMDELVHPSGRKTDLVNTNKLIRSLEGIQGGKTGHTSEAGYCIAVCSKQNDMRLISVVIGASDSKERFNDASKLIKYGFANFVNQVVVSKNQILGSSKFNNCSLEQINFVASKDLIVVRSKNETGEFNIELKLSDISLPLKKGQVVGTAIIYENGIVLEEIEVVSESDVKELTFWDSTRRILSNW